MGRVFLDQNEELVVAGSVAVVSWIMGTFLRKFWSFRECLSAWGGLFETMPETQRAGIFSGVIVYD
jgi:hypothetical protein